jgi:hypothetical protein
MASQRDLAVIAEVTMDVQRWDGENGEEVLEGQTSYNMAGTHEDIVVTKLNAQFPGFDFRVEMNPTGLDCIKWTRLQLQYPVRESKNCVIL